MCSKRYGLVLAAVAVAVLAGAPPAAAQTEVVNCVAAVVNGRIITLTDIKIADAFGFFDLGSLASAQERRRAVLEKLIDQKVVIGLARENAPGDPAKAESALADLLAKLGRDATGRLLEEFGLASADLLPYLEDQLLSATIIANRFGRSAGVSLRDIEDYYAATYVPAEKRLGREPKPLIDVLPAIEAEVKKAKVASQAALWVKSLRAQAEVEIRPDCIR